MDHDATFRFLLDPIPDSAEDGQLVDQLAAAARCTSSFPGAFEPHLVIVGEGAGDGLWKSSAGEANFAESQYVVDGGVLLNKPIRPALDAIYRRTADAQVRRVMAYVVPDPGEPSVKSTSGVDPVPTAREVVLGVLTRLRSTDSVSRELSEIRTRNADAHLRRRVRDRLAVAMTATADSLSEAAWDTYLEVRRGHAARTIGHLIAAGQRTSGRWSEQELVNTLRKVLDARHDAGAPLYFIREEGSTMRCEGSTPPGGTGVPPPSNAWVTWRSTSSSAQFGSRLPTRCGRRRSSKRAGY